MSALPSSEPLESELVSLLETELVLLLAETKTKKNNTLLNKMLKHGS